MQVNLNNLLNGKENVSSLFENSVHVRTEADNVEVKDEYGILKAENLWDDQMLTRVKTMEQTPMALTQENLKTLNENLKPEDFSKYEELGIIPEQDELGRVVTVSERIKIELAAHCDNYRGDISDISMDDLRRVMGDAAYSAFQEIRSMERISENAKAYLLGNEMQPTIENVYKAEHSGVPGTVNRLDDATWQELMPQVANILEKRGMEVTAESLSEGRFLIEHGISLTAENIQSAIDMNTNISGRTDGQWISDMVQIISLGMAPEQCSAVGLVPDKYMAQDIMDAIERGNEEQIGAVLAGGRELTVLNLKNPPTLEEIQDKINNDRLIASKKILEEIRQKMTFESCLTMLKRGIKVEIMPFEELSCKLTEIKEEQNSIFFRETDKTKTTLLESTIDMLERMKSVPSAVLGMVASGEAGNTVRDITVKGENVRSRFAEVERLYDAVGTEVRTDLGDSIKNAMNSSYSLLDEIGIKETESSRRAMRILGYNGMEISRENVLKIQALDEQVTKLFRNFTPEATAHIIEKGINPLDTDIDILNMNLDVLNEELGYTEEESFSKYLWRLEKNRDIPKEERSAYIGIYKLIRQVEKGDRRAIGAVIKSGEEVTLKNIYRALRSSVFQGREMVVDDNLGVTEQVNIKEENLSEQLSYFEKMYDGAMDRVWHYASPEQIRNIGLENFQDTELLELKEILENETDDGDYSQMRMEELKDARFVTEQGMEMILNHSVTVSASNILAASFMMSSRSGVWGRFRDEEIDMEESFKNLDMDNLDEEYREAVEKCRDKLSGQSGTIDVRHFRRLNGVIRLMGTLADKKSYIVPFNMDGETATMKITLVKDSGETGKVTIDIYSEENGHMAVELRKKKEGIAATVLGETEEAVTRGIKALENMKEEYGKISISNGVVDHIGEGIFGAKAGEYTQAHTAELYHMAKTFIMGIN